MSQEKKLNPRTPLVAKRPGCFKHSAGAYLSGAIYGMCATATAELIVIA